MGDSKDLYLYAVPLAWVLGGLCAGIIFEKIVLSRLRKFAKRTRWEGDEVILSSIRGMAILWFAAAGVYGAVLNTSLSPEILGMIKKVLHVVVIISATLVISKIVVGLVSMYAGREKEVLRSTAIFTSITRLVFLIIGGLIILQTFGISITPLLTALGVGGLAIALALEPTLSNLFSGIQILLSRQVRPGDYIKLDSGEEGYVIDVTWRNTRIQALSNNMTIVPNAKLASSNVVNYNLPEKVMSVLVQVGVSYSSDLERVEKVTLEVARQVIEELAGGYEAYEPLIRYHTFDDSSINFTVIMRVREFVDQYLAKHEFIKKLHRRYNEEGIEIPFPIRTVYMEPEPGDQM